MAGVSETRTYNALLTTTLANYRKKLMDNIFDDYPLLSWLNGKLGMAMRGSSVKRVIDSGETIVEHLLYELSSAVKRFSGYETLDTTPQEGMTIARYNWKQYAASISISGLERRSNMGEARMINLLESKTKQAEMTLRDIMNVDAFSDGTDYSSKGLGGLSILCDSSGTVGGLSAATYSWWASTETASGSFAGQGIDDMRTTFNTISRGNDKPDFIITTQTVHEYYEKALQPRERIIDSKVANAGFTNLTFKGVPVVFDRDCTIGVMYFLNSKYINLVCHRDADFSTGPFITPENQDASTAMILFQGNMTTNNRRNLAKMTGITA